MEMTGVGELLPDLRRVITGPLDISLEDAIFDACLSFCRRSEFVVLSRNIPKLTKGQQVEVSDNYDMQSCQILSVASTSELSAYHSGMHFLAINPNLITALEDMADVEIWFAAEPKRESGLIPRVLVSHYSDAISSGAAAALYLQPDRPWTDPRRSAEHQTRFTEGIRRAGRFRKNNASPDHVEFSNPTRRRNFI